MSTNISGDSGVVFEIERFAINDGPGIRTIVFLKGCPLSCKWCANPESREFENQLFFWDTKCIGCGRCVKQCPMAALTWHGRVLIDRDCCMLCGTCAETCYAEALEVVGHVMRADEVMAQVDRDARYYKESGGGVTFSGGEPFSQPEFLVSLASLAKERGYTTAVETSGYVPWETIERGLPLLDTFLFDLKCMDDATHRELTGVGNRLIQENFIRILEHAPGVAVVVRVPVITGLNSDDENCKRIIRFLNKHHPGCRVDILPYHRLGVSKYSRLGWRYPCPGIQPPTARRMQEIQDMFTAEGYHVVIGG